MSTTPVSMSVTPAEMLAATVSQVRELAESVRKDGRKYKLAYDGLAAGTDEADPAAIDRYRPLLDRARQMLDLNLTEVQYAQASIERLRGDRTLMATRADQVGTLAKAVAQARRQFVERVRLARELDRRAEQALAGVLKDRRDAEVEIGALRLRVRGTRVTLTQAMAEAEKLAAAAHKAYERRDQKALTDARTKLIDLKAYDGNVLRLRPEVETLRRESADLDREQRAEVQWMSDDLDRVQEIPAAIGRLVKETMALGQVPVQKAAPIRPKLAAADVAKLIRTFGLPDDGTRRAKAAKILADEAIEAWPRGLARLYGHKEAELKARLGDARKLPCVRSMALIDL